MNKQTFKINIFESTAERYRVGVEQSSLFYDAVTMEMSKLLIAWRTVGEHPLSGGQCLGGCGCQPPCSSQLSGACLYPKRLRSSLVPALLCVLRGYAGCMLSPVLFSWVLRTGKGLH